MRTRGEAHREAYEKILEIAGDLILRDGHERLSLREIARELGFGPASLYVYFDSREAIIQAVATRAVQSLREAMERRLGNLADDSDLVPGLGLAYVAWASTNPKDFLLLYQRPNCRRLPDSTPQSSPFAVFLEAVRRAHDVGSVPSGHSSKLEQLAYALWAAAHGMAMLQLSHRLPLNAELSGVERAVFHALVVGWR